jgi:ubiquinone/menaquinone biosynthesis C-methylase UbiE
VIAYYNSESTIQNMKDESFFNKDLWHTTLKFNLNDKHVNDNEFLIHISKINENTKIVDWGCGLGQFMRLIRDKYKCIMTGVNISEKQIKIANDKFNGENKEVTFVLHKTIKENLNISDNSIDRVVSQEAIVHHPDKLTLFKDIYRILKPNGIFAFQDWFLIDNELAKRTDEMYKSFLEPIENYIEYLEKAGFIHIKIFEPIDGVIIKRNKRMGFNVKIIYAEKPMF